MEVNRCWSRRAKRKRQDRRASVWRGVEESPRTRYAVPGTNGAGVKAMGLEACMTLGTLSESQRSASRTPGWITTTTTWTPRRVLRQYHHHTHLSGTPRYAGKVRDAGIKVCSGGIVGLGET